uniref:Protein CNPPD1 n=1 Tax=Glossina palpalis gambiensis TaxID=67801 RepID=A0A1B0BXV7_9MUSC
MMQECVANPAKTTSKKKVMHHDDFMKRVRKSLYFGYDLYDEDALEISKPLAEYASELFSNSHRGHTLNRLSYVDASSVQQATPAALIMALIYLDRLNVTDPSYVRRITPHELFIVSMMISTKFYIGHDEEIYLSDWADDGNISENHLKQLELEFLCAIDWNIYISNEQFFDKLTKVEKTLARREGLRRGWLTYSELMQMLPSFTLAKFLLNNVTIMAVSYAASVMTIAGAFFLASQIPGTSLHRKPNVFNDATIANSNLKNTEMENTNAKMNSSVSIMNPMGNQINRTNQLSLRIANEFATLERQYRDESVHESLQKKQREIATESHLPLPQQLLLIELNMNERCGKHGKSQQQQDHWFAHKEEYSDYCKFFMNQLPVDGTRQSIKKNDDKTNFDGYKFQTLNKKRNNSSSVSLLWHFFANTIQQGTLMRLPLLWLKFM